MSQFSKKTLEYLAELARIEITEKKEEKILKDLQNILGYFEELKEADTENIESMTGGTIEKNIFREDERSDNQEEIVKQNFKIQQVSYKKDKFIAEQEKNKLISAFPEEENKFLKIPPVFE